MRALAPTILLSLAVGYALAHFAVLLFNHWYFAEHFWLKVALLTPLIAAAYFALLFGSWRPVWLFLGAWWIASHLLAWVPARGADLRGLEFVAVLDFEAAVVWLPTVVLGGYGIWRLVRWERAQAAKRRTVARELKLRQELRRRRRQVTGARREAAGAAPEGE